MRLIDPIRLKQALAVSAIVEDKKTIEQIIDEQPTIEPEQKMGKWIAKDLDNFRKYEVVCSECGSRYIGNYDAYDEPCDFNFCPNCGADMRGNNNEID